MRIEIKIKKSYFTPLIFFATDNINSCAILRHMCDICATLLFLPSTTLFM